MIKINKSPCVGCKRRKTPCARLGCLEFKKWVHESWPVVVRGMRRAQWSRRVPPVEKELPIRVKTGGGRKARRVVSIGNNGEETTYKSVPIASKQLHLATTAPSRSRRNVHKKAAPFLRLPKGKRRSAYFFGD